ncbi:MAG: class I SAM-dependent methyltransferase, partial [Planctomycetota bacterium]
MGDYFIKDGYEHRTVNATLEEAAGDYWTPFRLSLSRHAQFAVYDLAGDIVRREQLTSVIDVGCGLGHKLDELIRPLPSLTSLVGVDQPTCVERSRELFPGIDFVAADFERPAESGLGPADLVMSVDVIEHMLDPDLLLDFIRGHTHA